MHAHYNQQRQNGPLALIAPSVLVALVLWGGLSVAEPLEPSGSGANATARTQAPTQKAASEVGRWALVPVVLPAYQPETSFLVAAAGILAHEYPKGSTRRESQVMVAAAASLRRQYSLLLRPDLFLFDERFHLGATLSVARFPDLFYGLGNDTRARDEEPFTPVFYDVTLSPKLRLVRGGYLGPRVRYLRTELRRTQAEGQLASGQIPGSRGGTSLELGAEAFLDTRDRTLYPRHGGIIQARLASSRRDWGADFNYDLLRVDGRWYWSLPWPGHILAGQALAELRGGMPPFYDTGMLGGAEMLRGYYEGRYRDRQYLALQAEHRFPLFWRLGATLFVAAGNVAPQLAELEIGRTKAAVGAGLRVAPVADLPINIRLDVAYGNDLNFYFGLGEAF